MTPDLLTQRRYLNKRNYVKPVNAAKAPASPVLPPHKQKNVRKEIPFHETEDSGEMQREWDSGEPTQRWAKLFRKSDETPIVGRLTVPQTVVKAIPASTPRPVHASAQLQPAVTAGMQPGDSTF